MMEPNNLEDTASSYEDWKTQWDRKWAATPWWKKKWYRFRGWAWSAEGHLRPKTWYRAGKWFIQRGRRGWADCDTWSLDWYLARVISEATVYLRDHLHSIPPTIIEESDHESTVRSNLVITGSEGEEEYIERWKAILDVISQAFKEYNRLHDEISIETMEEFKQKMPQVREDMKLLLKHFSDLWD